MVSSEKPVAFGFHPYQVGTGIADTKRSLGQTMDFDVGEYVDNSPQMIAGLVLGALVTMVALKALGFRFAIGVGN